MKTRLFIVLTVALTVPVLFLAPHSFSQSPAALKNEQEEMRQVMITLSRQLGVTCTSCHVENNYSSDKMVTFKLAKEHMRLTQLLIDNGMDGKRGPKADCFMCHRGKLKPDHVEKVNPITQSM
jgi:hypothetical protein